MWNVFYTRKSTREQFLYGTFATEEQALKVCEEWGWEYDDGHESFWLSYERSAQ